MRETNKVAIHAEKIVNFKRDESHIGNLKIEEVEGINRFEKFFNEKNWSLVLQC